VLMFLAVVVTGNHFIFDALVGGLVSLVGLVLALLLHRYGDTLKRALLANSSSGPPGLAS
ncbi:MAG: hypothetical protein ACE5IZ_02945, partial [Dehalococcoidia bacterium]